MFKANIERMKEFTIFCFDGKINPERTLRLKAQQFIEEKHKISKIPVFLFRWLSFNTFCLILWIQPTLKINLAFFYFDFDINYFEFKLLCVHIKSKKKLSFHLSKNKISRMISTILLVDWSQSLLVSYGLDRYEIARYCTCWNRMQASGSQVPPTALHLSSVPMLPCQHWLYQS